MAVLYILHMAHGKISECHNSVNIWQIAKKTNGQYSIVTMIFVKGFCEIGEK